jgi:hypothetical protein
MELNATQEALERAQRGIDLLEKLNASPAADRVIARLHEATSRALRRAKMFEAAFARATEMVRHARAARDQGLLMMALMRASSVQSDLGTIGGSALAVEALAIASDLGDDAHVAVAYAQISFGHMWQAEERPALEAGKAALEAARRSGNNRAIALAADPLQRVQTAWWHFEDAAKTVALMREKAVGIGWIGEANAAGWMTHFYYFAGQIAAAADAIEEARSVIARQTKASAEDADLGIAAINHFVEGVAALVAIELGAFDVALRYETIRRRFPAVGPHYYANYGLMVPIDALLLRDGPGDRERAATMIEQLTELHYGPWLSSHLTPSLLRARMAARQGHPHAAPLVRAALDETERIAELCPGDCYRAFDRLATAAADAGDVETAAHAVDLRDRWISRHAAALAPLLAASKL